MVSNRCRVVLRAFFLFVTLLAKRFKVLIEFYAEASITVVMHMESGAVHPSVLIVVHPTAIAESVFLQVGASPPAPFLAVDVLVIIHRAVEIAPEFVHWSGTQTAILHLCASSLPNHCLTTSAIQTLEGAEAGGWSSGGRGKGFDEANNESGRREDPRSRGCYSHEMRE